MPRRRRARRALLACAVVAVCGACSSGSGGGSHAGSTTTAPTTTTTRITPPTVTPPTVTRPTVPSGPVVPVPASIDPTGRADVTNALQRFLASVPSGREILFRKAARYRVEGTLFLRDRHRLTIDGNGAIVYATTRGKPDRAQWWIKGGAHIIFRDLRVRGANPNAGTGDSAYVAKLETQHGFRLEGVNGAELDRVQVNDVYGDFVYIGRGKDRIPCRNIWVHDSQFSRNGRQGVAVTAATNVIIERNHLSQTRRSTFDLEPDARSALVSNIFVLNNVVGPGRLLFLASHGRGPVNNVVISGNRLLGHSLTIDSMAPDHSRRSNWVVVDNTSNVPVQSRPMRFFGIDGLAVRDNRQQVTGGEPVVVLTDVCGAQISGNQFASAPIRESTAHCDAPLVVPAVPAMAGRGKTTPGPPVSTSIGPSSSVAPSSVGRATAPVTHPTAPGSGGGFDLADWIFVALGACLLGAVALTIRARRRR